MSDLLGHAGWLASARPRRAVCALLACAGGAVGLLAGLLALLARSVPQWWSWSAEMALLALPALLVAAGAIPAWLLAHQRFELSLAGDDAGAAGPTAQLRRWAGVNGVLAGLPALAFAALVAWRCWPRGGGTGGELTLGIAALVLAFPALVAERHLSRNDGWDDGARLALLCRLAVAVLALGALATLAHALGLEAAIWGQRLASAVVLAVCAELAVRAALVPLLPLPRPEQARIWTTSTIAMLVTAATPGGRPGGRFHLDLSQSWALAFLRRIAPLLALLAALGAWGTTAFTALALDERGVYERFGRPVAVLGPGLHGHLPWPFGAVRRVELGTVHDLALGAEQALPVIAAEARPGAAFDRLWDRSHPAESTFVLPGPGAGMRGQAYQLVDSDVRVLWRVGLDDGHAIAAAYRVVDGAGLVRTLAASLLTAEFSTRTLDQVIGIDRDALAGTLRQRLQDALDAFGSGIELTAVVIDAIHPPPGAAGAYHGVQAAAIGAATEVSVARSQANRARHEADAAAAAAGEGSRALAAELRGRAAAERNRFAADSAAQRSSGGVLALERWFQALSRSLARAQLTVVDHRLGRDELPLIDLRPSPLPAPAMNEDDP